MRYTGRVGDAAMSTAGRQRQILPGTLLGRYRVIRRIAAGGMAEVYLAKPEGSGDYSRPVALKLVLPHLAEDPQFVALFEHEARIALRVGHPNIAQVFELARTVDELFLVMEFVDGHTLQRLLGESQGPLPLACALSILVHTCAAIHHAHEATNEDGSPLHLVHRDISPSNVMVRHDGVVKVVDFGIAKALSETGLTKTGSLKGKAGYMSPEQCAGKELTRVSDVFNLGILLYETTTGQRAFAGSNIFSVMNKIVDGRYTRPSKVVPDYPPELEAIVQRVLSLDPAQRHETALALREDLEAFARTQALGLSEQPVAAWIEDRLGPPEPLDLSTVELLPPESEDGLLPRVGRIPGWAKTVGIGGLAGTVAFFVLSRSTEEPPAPEDPQVEASGKEPRPAPADPAPPAQPVEVASVEHEAPQPEAAEPQAPVVGPAEPRAAGGDEKPGTTTRASPKKKRRRPRKKKTARGEKEPLFPWKD